MEKETQDFLKSMGFTRSPVNEFVYYHEMIDFPIDFTLSSEDNFWIMNTIFKKCIDIGRVNQNIDIQRLLGLL